MCPAWAYICPEGFWWPSLFRFVCLFVCLFSVSGGVWLILWLERIMEGILCSNHVWAYISVVNWSILRLPGCIQECARLNILDRIVLPTSHFKFSRTIKARRFWSHSITIFLQNVQLYNWLLDSFLEKGWDSVENGIFSKRAGLHNNKS